jgi:hypothetical protein
MAIKLGPAGSQTTLPDIVWPSGSEPEIPYTEDELVEEERMADGSNRFIIHEFAPGTWTLVWDGIPWSDVQTIWAVISLKQLLVFTNEYTDNVDHNVIVTARSYSLKAGTAQATPLYVLTATLREQKGT